MSLTQDGITRHLQWTDHKLEQIGIGLDLRKIEVDIPYDPEDHDGTDPDTHIPETQKKVNTFLSAFWTNATEDDVEQIEEDLEKLLEPTLNRPSVTLRLGR